MNGSKYNRAMPTAYTRLPKVNLPLLQRVLRRPRINALLEATRDAPLVWVFASPGTGKTTAVAAYVGGKKTKTAWLKMDASDRDAASFFHYLGVSVATALPRQRFHFPILGPEYHDNLSSFAHIFFRYLAERVKQPLKLVFDNAQEACTATWIQLIKAAAEEFTSNLQIIIISREPPAAQLMRVLANHQLALIDTSALRFTQEEIEKLFAMSKPIQKWDVDALYKMTDGWVTGLILLRESSTGTLIGTDTPTKISQENIFNYFDSEIFAQANTDLQHIFLQTAYLTDVTVIVAQRLSGHAHAGDLLESWCQRNLFIQRKSGEPLTYEYHALFRQFLIAHVEQTYPSARRQYLQITSAHWLKKHGQIENAVSLLLSAHAWNEAAELILEHAELWSRQGRHQLLGSWLFALPEPVCEENPWLLFWLAETHLTTDEKTAWLYLERARDAFTRQGDVSGQLLTAATALEAIHAGYYKYSQMNKWADTFERLYDKAWSASQSDQLRIASGCLLAILVGVKHKHSSQPITKIQSLLFEDIDVNRKIGAASILLEYLYRHRAIDLARDLTRIVTPLLKLPTVTVFSHVHWLIILGYTHYTLENNLDLALKTLAEAADSARDAGLAQLFAQATRERILLLLTTDRVSEAKEALSTVTSSDFNFSSDPLQHHTLLARIALAEENNLAALAHSRMALEYCEENDLPGPVRFISTLAHVYSLLVNRSYGEAKNLLSSMDSCAMNRTEIFNKLRRLLLAHIALETTNTNEAIELLRHSLAEIREAKFMTFCRFVPSIARSLCRTALAENIETDFVISVIAQRKLLPPQPDWESWPWDAHVRCLGPLELTIKGEAVITSGKKAWKKPLQLLQGILTYGNKAAPANELARLLWPGEKRVGKEHTLSVTLHRLRKLLGDENAIIVKENHISLNPQCLWVDAWALDTILKRWEEGARADTKSLETIAAKIFTIYRGHLLSDAPQALRLIAPVQELWSRVKRFILELGKMYESNDAWEQAAALYRLGIERAPLTNEFYSVLIGVLIRLGKVEEAHNVYASCNYHFQTLRGREPTHQLTTLVRDLPAQRAGLLSSLGMNVKE